MSKNNGAELQLSKKGSMMHYRRLATPYLLLAPMLAFVMCFMIWPIINVFMMSTESYKVTKPNDRHFIGLERPDLLKDAGQHRRLRDSERRVPDRAGFLAGMAADP